MIRVSVIVGGGCREGSTNLPRGHKIDLKSCDFVYFSPDFSFIFDFPPVPSYREIHLSRYFKCIPIKQHKKNINLKTDAECERVCTVDT